MKLEDYLSRINFHGETSLSSETLHSLQGMHLRTVPFENLDISLGRKIQLDLNSLWDKIIVKRRGGFCYELNGLFAWLLKEIGFDVTYLNARDYHEENDTFGIDFDHLTLLVKTPNETTRWLVDVGWGDTFTQPLDIDTPNWQDQGMRAYRLEPFRNGYQLWQRGNDGKTDRQYYFELTPHNFPLEYEAACVYHQTSPNSIFTKNRIISRATEDGRVSLDNDELIITRYGQKTRTPIHEEERPALLKAYFDVIL
ncbi:MAG: arylamine N-acetyltransferase [Anaerolineales bacterium]|nr:arylamine N-acetyltransferase [Anaerolineales bacterium]